MPELLFELVGPAYDLAEAEIFSALNGLGWDYELKQTSTGVVLLKSECSPKEIGERLGLTHRVLDHLKTPTRETLSSGDVELKLPDGSAAVRTRKIKGAEMDTEKIRKDLGEQIKDQHPIDLSAPENTVLVLISDRCHIGLVSYQIDKNGFKARDLENREFFSPISLKPRYARALVNLARPKEGDRMHDPFCGTGGILLEGYELDLKVSAGDLDPEMVEGTKQNMKQFSVKGDVTVGDVSKNTPDHLDCIVTDPPYGRSASTSGEDLENIYRKLFETAADKLKDGGRLSTIFPEKKYCHMGDEYLELEDIYPVRTHGSLVRNYCIFKK